MVVFSCTWRGVSTCRYISALRQTTRASGGAPFGATRREGCRMSATYGPFSRKVPTNHPGVVTPHIEITCYVTLTSG
jgi:hypothetical protein